MLPILFSPNVFNISTISLLLKTFSYPFGTTTSRTLCPLVNVSPVSVLTPKSWTN